MCDPMSQLDSWHLSHVHANTVSGTDEPTHTLIGDVGPVTGEGGCDRPQSRQLHGMNIGNLARWTDTYSLCTLIT